VDSNGIGEPIFGDRRMHWGHIATAQKLSGKWMPPHEQEVESNYGQAESIVIERPNYLIEAFALQFGWSELFLTNLAHERFSTHSDLERVTVDKRCNRILRNQYARLIEVADDAPSRMNPGHGSCDVERGAQQESKTGARKSRSTAGWRIEVVYLPLARYQRH